MISRTKNGIDQYLYTLFLSVYLDMYFQLQILYTLLLVHLRAPGIFSMLNNTRIWNHMYATSHGSALENSTSTTRSKKVKNMCSGCVRTANSMNCVQEIWSDVKERNPNEPEFLQAVEEVLQTAGPVFARHPEYVQIMRRLVEPERMIIFRVRNWNEILRTCLD